MAIRMGHHRGDAEFAINLFQDTGSVLYFVVSLIYSFYMTRPLRLEYPGALYHLTARGNAKQDIYLADEDRERFLNLLGREVDQQGWRCYAFCLMSNHYHLLIETPEGNLVAGMRRLNGHYTQGFNKRHGRVGHLFQGRYKSIVVEKDSYLLELCRYISLNPVRAGLVKEIAAWPWSSYLSTAYGKPKIDWLDTNSILNYFGRTNRSARKAYRRFIQDGLDLSSPWQKLRGQIWLGSESFMEKMQQLIEDDLIEGIPSEQTNPARPTIEAIIEQITQRYKISEQVLWSRENQEAFKAGVYLLRRVSNLPLKEVATIVGISVARISQIQREVELGNASRILKQLMHYYKVKN